MRAIRYASGHRPLMVALLLVVLVPLAAAAVAARYDPLSACPGLYERRVDVATEAQLRAALADARPGDLIELAEGVYRGRFELTRDGERSRPITVCGRRAAVIEGPDIVPGEYGIHIQADHWQLVGFTIRHHSKGIVADDGDFLVLRGLEIHDIGGEGIRLRTHSSDNLITESWIYDTGVDEPDNGEGIYIGTAESQWCRNTECEPDLSDRNRVIANAIGPGTTAESIDIKEGTTGGLVADNVFDGSGMTATDSWLDVKGNNWRIVDNRGTNAPWDGFQTHMAVPGWGRDNHFSGNIADVRGPGHGFDIDVRGEGNLVSCDNIVRRAGSGFANVGCAATSGAGRPMFLARLAVGTTR